MTERRAYTPPRLMTRDEAARYCRMSPPAFDRACPVRPILIGEGMRLRRYDRNALDRWIDKLQGVHTDDVDDDEWLSRAGNGRRAG